MLCSKLLAKYQEINAEILIHYLIHLFFKTKWIQCTGKTEDLALLFQ